MRKRNITLVILVLAVILIAVAETKAESSLSSDYWKYSTTNFESILSYKSNQKKRTVYYFPAKRYEVIYSKRPRKTGMVLFLGPIKTTQCTYRRPGDIYYVTKYTNEQFRAHVEAYYKSNLGVGFIRRIDPPSQAKWDKQGNLESLRRSTVQNSRSTLVTVSDFSLECF